MLNYFFRRCSEEFSRCSLTSQYSSYYLSVILFTGGGEYLGRYPRDQAHPPDQVPPGRYTPQVPGTSPQAGTAPQDQVHLRDQGTPPETATVADGTHPTGMHSCWSLFHLSRFSYRSPDSLFTGAV